MDGDVFGQECLVFLPTLRLQDNVLRDVKPCLREFRDEASFPSGVVGPCDLAPLMRDVSDFKSEGMFSLLPSMYRPNCG
jgi:hypothetical protein